MILDVVMPEMSGVAAVPYVIAAAPGCKIILYSAIESPASRNPRSIGAHGFASKTESYSTLTTVLRQLFPGTCTGGETTTAIVAPR